MKTEKVFSPLNLPPVLPTCEGNKFRKEYQRREREVTREPYLVEVGETDIQAEIDSYLPATSLSTLYNRYAFGDVTALNQKSGGFYADVSKVGDLNNVVDQSAKLVRATAALKAKAKTSVQSVPGKAEESSAAPDGSSSESGKGEA